MEPPRARLDVAAEPADGQLLIRLGGELDLAGLPAVQPALPQVRRVLQVLGLGARLGLDGT